MTNKLKVGVVLKGKEAIEFFEHFPIRRNDLRYSFTTKRDDKLYMDFNTYFDAGDGRIFSATVIEDLDDFLIASGYTEKDLPRVSVIEVWESEEEVLKNRQQIWDKAEESEDGHILKKWTENNPHFPDELPEWIKRIAQFLKVSENDLDFSIRSLFIIDEGLKQQKVKHKDLLNKLFGPLLGYIGEVIRIAKNGKWHMQVSKSENTVWEPSIITIDREYISWYIQMWDYVNEDYKNFSTYSVIKISTDL